MTQTVLGIINRSLRLLGVAHAGEASDPNEVADAFSVLNMMIGQWNNKRLLLFGFTNELFDVTAGDGVYTIGPGGDFDTNRPTKIDRAFMRYNADSPSLCYDYKLEIVPNDKYQEIFVKKFATTYPIYLFYNNTFPLGEITLYPYPVQASQLGLSTWAQISKFTNYAQDIDLPDGYESALAYNLTMELAPEYGKELDPIIANKAAETMADLMSTNQQLAYLKADGMVTPHRSYNIYTGVAR
jgi:hypothetical protein